MEISNYRLYIRYLFLLPIVVFRSFIEIINGLTRGQLFFKIRELLHLYDVEKSIIQLFGPEEFNISKHDVVVCCLFKNGEYYLPSFLNHYHSMGISKFVFLDNGSTDKSIEIIKQHENVIIIRSKLSFKRYNISFKKYLLKKYGLNRWTLLVDIDELWIYPYYEKVPLSNLISYLERFQFNAVQGIMLDMFSSKSIDELKNDENRDLKSMFPFYDTRGIVKEESFRGIKNYVFCYGGVSKTFFGVDESMYLSKIPLTKFRSNTMIYDLHWIDGVNLADFSTTLLHYRFNAKFEKKVKDIVSSKHYKGTISYVGFQNKLKNNPSISLFSVHSKKLTDSEDLLKDQIMNISEQYKNNLTGI